MLLPVKVKGKYSVPRTAYSVQGLPNDDLILDPRQKTSGAYPEDRRVDEDAEATFLSLKGTFSWKANYIYD